LAIAIFRHLNLHTFPVILRKSFPVRINLVHIAPLYLILHKFKASVVVLFSSPTLPLQRSVHNVFIEPFFKVSISLCIKSSPVYFSILYHTHHQSGRQKSLREFSSRTGKEGVVTNGLQVEIRNRSIVTLAPKFSLVNIERQNHWRIIKSNFHIKNPAS
jgi:hypothetical protein